MYKPDYIVIHHSAGNETLSALAAEKKYHFVVHQAADGSVTWRQSVPCDMASGYAVGGFNSRSCSICVIGNFNERKPSSACLDLLVQICAARCRAWGIPASRIVSHGFVGRNLVSVRYSTECCGRNLEAQLRGLQDRVARYL